MKVTVWLKNLPRSPQKVGLVTNAIKKLEPKRALEALPYLGKQAAGDVAKLIKSGLAAAQNKGADPDSMVIESIATHQGSRSKRFRPGSKGRSTRFVHRFSHISLTLAQVEPKASQTQKTSIKKDKPLAKPDTEVKK